MNLPVTFVNFHTNIKLIHTFKIPSEHSETIPNFTTGYKLLMLR